ncbi:MAG TPA: YaaR family protein, partial [Chondromyces sp.]|nr:YaaR family protein [Chondromyces sp.]
IDQTNNETKLPNSAQVKFGELVEQQEQKMRKDQLSQLLLEIESAGEKLANSRTFQDLAKYKNLVRRFVRETIDFGMELKQSHTWNQFGEGRQLRIVETIDKKLVELTEEVLNKEKSPIDLLRQIGEVKGLLVNLYT